MQGANILFPIEKVTYIDDGFHKDVINGEITTYLTGTNKLGLVDEVYQIEMIEQERADWFKFSNRELGDVPPVGSETIFDKDPRYILDYTYKYDDLKGNLIQIEKDNYNTISYIWGYNNSYLIAKVANAENDEIFYTSFETLPSIEGWTTYELSDLRSKTGRYSLRTTNPDDNVDYYFVGSFLDINNSTTTKYKYSCWVYCENGLAGLWFFMKPNSDNEFYSDGWDAFSQSTGVENKWVLLEGEVDVPSEMRRIYLRIDNNDPGAIIWFDDIRLYPADAMMSSYTYDPLIGMTSETDSRNITTTYEYDDLRRLHIARDHKGNIIKKHEYNYATPWVYVASDIHKSKAPGVIQTEVYKNNIIITSISKSNDSWFSFTPSFDNDVISLNISFSENGSILRRSGYIYLNYTINGVTMQEKIKIKQDGTLFIF